MCSLADPSVVMAGATLVGVETWSWMVMGMDDVAQRRYES